MCLYTKYITNKKYQPNRKNNFNAPVCEDRRLLLVPAKCGRCIECRKARKREWVIRLNEEIRNNPEKATFWTLTISNENYENLKSDSKKKDRDSICNLFPASLSIVSLVLLHCIFFPRIPLNILNFWMFDFFIWIILIPFRYLRALNCSR